MTIHTVDEVFERLKSFKITAHKESVRRWLRQGVIKGIAPSSRKEGWQIPKEALDDFIKIRLPNAYTTNVAKELDSDNVLFNEKEVEERIRAVMWGELANKNM